MADSYRADVIGLLDQHQPKSLLALGPKGADLFEAYAHNHPQCVLDVLDGDGLVERLEGLGRYDFGFISDVLEQVTPSRAGVILSRMRDLHTRRLLVAVPIGSQRHPTCWKHTQLLSYGLSLHARHEINGEPVYLYSFAIEDYKPTPDWLNAECWANPEHFGKYRW